MTGYQNGAIAITERIVGKPLHYFICFSHLNELPWRHYLVHVLGRTKSTDGWKSDWLNLHDVESRPVAKFTAQPNPDFPQPPPEIVRKFSQDQQVLLELCQAIMAG
jgi:hypothetical protein